MRALLFTVGILGSQNLLAHPGHGGAAIHAHLADVALIAFGAFMLTGMVLLVRKALKK